MRCDTNTFAQMYEQIYTDLYRFALCMMKHPQDAEDVVSEAVIKAYENIRKLQKEEAFKSWMFTILANTCKKRLKKHAKERTEEMSEDGAEQAVHMPDTALAMDVRNAFFVLQEDEQMIVGLSVFGGYNSQEIGSILKMPSGTVRSKRSRALAKMECILK